MKCFSIACLMIVIALCLGDSKVMESILRVKRQETKAGGIAGTAKEVLDVISKLTQVEKVSVENQASAEIYLKCASKDDDIGWHTLEKGDVSLFG